MVSSETQDNPTDTGAVSQTQHALALWIAAIN
jgi:hypothetical protein